MSDLEKKVDNLAIAVKKGFDAVNVHITDVEHQMADVEHRMATKDDLRALREEIGQDVDITLDKHLQTYMHRYDDLAERVKRLEEKVGV